MLESSLGLANKKWWKSHRKATTWLPLARNLNPPQKCHGLMKGDTSRDVFFVGSIIFNTTICRVTSGFDTSEVSLLSLQSGLVLRCSRGFPVEEPYSLKECVRYLRYPAWKFWDQGDLSSYSQLVLLCILRCVYPTWRVSGSMGFPVCFFLFSRSLTKEQLSLCQSDCTSVPRGLRAVLHWTGVRWDHPGDFGKLHSHSFGCVVFCEVWDFYKKKTITF